MGISTISLGVIFPSTEKRDLITVSHNIKLQNKMLT